MRSLALTVLVVLGSLPATLHAAPISYQSLATFQADAATAGIVLQTENFAGNSWGTVVTPAFTVTVVPPEAFFELAATPLFANSAAIQWSGIGTVTFTFADPIHAFGFDIFNLGNGSLSTLTFSVNGQEIEIYVDYTSDDNDPIFAGIIDTQSFSTIAVTIDTTATSGNFVNIDDVRFGAAASTSTPDNGLQVPEPAGLLLWALAGVVALRRRTRHKWAQR
jgi:hypothetical protein